jgi:WD40 repeat protein
LSLLSSAKVKKAKLSLPILLFSGGFDNKLRVWDVVTGAHQQALSGHPHEITTITAYYQTSSQLVKLQGSSTSTEGKSSKEAANSNVVIYSGSADGSIRIWDLNAGTCNYVLEGHVGAIVDCCYVFGLHPTVVSCSTDGAVRTWNSLTGKAMRTYKWHKESGASGMHVKKGLLSFAPLKIVIGTCSLDNTLLMHELDSGSKSSGGCCCIS